VHVPKNRYASCLSHVVVRYERREEGNNGQNERNGGSLAAKCKKFGKRGQHGAGKALQRSFRPRLSLIHNGRMNERKLIKSDVLPLRVGDG
jgi:hypothetical protein